MFETNGNVSRSPPPLSLSPPSLKLTFEQRQLLELDILRVAIAGGALRLLGLLLEGSLGEGVYPVHEGPWRHFGINGGTVALSWWWCSNGSARACLLPSGLSLSGADNGGCLATRDRDHLRPEEAAFRGRRPRRVTHSVPTGERKKGTHCYADARDAALHPLASILPPLPRSPVPPLPSSLSSPRDPRHGRASRRSRCAPCGEGRRWKTATRCAPPRTYVAHSTHGHTRTRTRARARARARGGPRFFRFFKAGARRDLRYRRAAALSLALFSRPSGRRRHREEGARWSPDG